MLVKDLIPIGISNWNDRFDHLEQAVYLKDRANLSPLSLRHDEGEGAAE
jgi:hypothetical protein